MRKVSLAFASLLVVVAAPAVAKDKGNGHGNGHGKGHGAGHVVVVPAGPGYYHQASARNCPPGLRDKGCLPPGQAKKLYRVGQRLPGAYGSYNLPDAYQTRYIDNRDAYYRYSDGYIYQIDPTTRAIEAVIRAVLG